jgi:hypothetical protein
LSQTVFAKPLVQGAKQGPPGESATRCEKTLELRDNHALHDAIL